MGTQVWAGEYCGLRSFVCFWWCGRVLFVHLGGSHAVAALVIVSPKSTFGFHGASRLRLLYVWLSASLTVAFVWVCFGFWCPSRCGSGYLFGFTHWIVRTVALVLGLETV